MKHKSSFNTSMFEMKRWLKVRVVLWRVSTNEYLTRHFYRCHSTSFSTSLRIVSFRSDWTIPLFSRYNLSLGVNSGCQFPSKRPMCCSMLWRTPLWRGFSNNTSLGLRFTTLPSNRVMNLSAFSQARFLPRGCSAIHWKKSHFRLVHLKKSLPGFFFWIGHGHRGCIAAKAFQLV